LKEDKEIVLAAVKSVGAALKYAKGGLNQDGDCLKAAGLWDEVDDKVYSRTEQAILSVKFSLAEKSTEFATEFALAMKEDKFLQNFKTYNPNAWCKKSCDPDFTTFAHECRGTLSTCKFPEANNRSPDTLRPCPTSCWRYAFRFHQEESKTTNGFMIQVEEKKGLGDGQKIETEMAKQVNLKVFRAYTNFSKFQLEAHYLYGTFNGIDAISKAVQEWYENGCANNDLENIFIGCQAAVGYVDRYDNNSSCRYTTRPRYEKLQSAS